MMLRLYCALARLLLPREFMREYGVELERSIAARLRRAPVAGWRLLLFVREVGDLLRTAAAEWADEFRSDRTIAKPSRTRLGDAIGQDLSRAVRQARRTPGFTVLAVLMIGMGVGPTAAVYSIVKQVILTPLLFEQPEELVMIWPHATGEERVRGHLSQPNIESLSGSALLSSLVGVNTTSAAVTGLGQAEVVLAGRSTGGLMEVLGEQPLMGRDLVRADARLDAPRVVVVSHQFWQTRLDGSSEVLGMVLRLFEEPYEIVGVAPPGFGYPEESLLWTPMAVPPEGCGRGCKIIERALGRLEPGVTVEDAMAGAEVVASRLSDAYPDEFPDGSGFWVESMLDFEVGEVRTGLFLTFGAVGLLLLIVCANMANLLVTRAAGRRKEIVIRAALGASNRRLVSQVSIESALLVAGGATVGAMLATGIVMWVRVFAYELIPRMSEVTVDVSALLILIAITALAVVGFGVRPALQARDAGSMGAMVRAARHVGARSDSRIRTMVLAGEVALCVISLAAAGLLLRSAQKLEGVDMGFDGTQVTRFTLVPPVSQYPERVDLVEVVAAIEEEIGRITVVQAVGSVFGAPLTTDRLGVRVSVEGGPPDQERRMVYRPATAGYFGSMGIPIKRGRGLRRRALLEGSPEAVINELGAVALFGAGEDPVGRSVTVTSLFGVGSMRVVGVVGDVRRNITADPVPAVYPLASTIKPAWRGLVVHVRTRPGSQDMIQEIREAVARVDTDLIAALPETVSEARNRETLRTRVFGTLLTSFAFMTVFLAGIGLYGVVGFLVSQRTAEIGLRIALGAGPRSVTTLVVAQGLGYSGLGLAVGLGVVALGGGAMEALLYGVIPFDPRVLGAAAAVVMVVAVVASLAPIRAAIRVDPVVALRAE